jgi:spore germination protein GerM
MVEPTGHCPYLGLKQNRAIRFSSPTLEHRCYVGGEPIEIPVDQASYCLSRNHINCPLYMGLTVPTTSDTAAAGAAGVAAAGAGGLRGWYATLPPRDRVVYALMIGMLALIVVIYLIAGLQSFGVGPGLTGGATPSAAPTTAPGAAAATVAARPSPSATTAPPSATAEPPTATPEPPTPTTLPTSTQAPRPTAAPTEPTIILPPTASPATAAPRATVAPTQAQATAVPATSAPTQPAAPSPQPSVAPTQAPPTRAPSPPTQPPAPVAVSEEVLWLYFADPTGSLYVPVQRRVRVEDRKVGEAAIRELIAGARPGLERLLLPDTRLLGLTIRDGTAFVNFDRAPNGEGDERGLYAIALTLTHFPSVERVQILVNGQAHGLDGGGPIGRPVVNPLNPDGLPFDYGTTEFLPTYYLTADGRHTVRIIRMTPKTRETAAGTLYALLDGPGEYAYAVQRVIPGGTGLLGVGLENGVATVNFTPEFTEAGNRDAAVRTVVESLTTLRTISGVRFLVDGQSLANYWGEPYGQVFPRPLINPE